MKHNRQRTLEITMEAAQKILNANQHYSWAYNLYGSSSLEIRRFRYQPGRSLENADIGFTIQYSSSHSVKHDWLWAEYYAQTGEMKKAIEIGNETHKQLPSHMGFMDRVPLDRSNTPQTLFRLSAMAMEIVPQMVEMPVPAIWLERTDLLKTWEEQVQ